MGTTVHKWGNSLAIRIPHSVIEAAAIDQGTELEWHATDSIILTVKKKEFTLEDLLSKITRRIVTVKLIGASKGMSCCDRYARPRRSVYMNFNPQLEHEQAGTRPAIVLSPKTLTRSRVLPLSVLSLINKKDIPSRSFSRRDSFFKELF